MMAYVDLGSILTALTFVILGLVVFLFAFRLMWPALLAAVRQEILEKQNLAAAVVFAAVVISLALIVAAAVH